MTTKEDRNFNIQQFYKYKDELSDFLIFKIHDVNILTCMLHVNIS